MGPHLQSVSRWRHSTLARAAQARSETRPPAPGSAWQRLLQWLMAPAPAAGPASNRVDKARQEFLEALADIAGAEAAELRLRLYQTHSLHGLWHLRAEVYRAVGVAHSQAEAERRMAALNRHFPTRAPRSNWVPL